ncbi:glucose-6-phosphate dehydrogenase [Lactiplantibacillus mudanjiangensis]|uniref:Glucose-6-phosphate 1-dehydrogenase n=1 Tax=Lactiplantibacillus mudanjiangensis TaxID=1296538 RepID=A0A660DYN2_9LACO|nr:glucose-6-phosphate dehydrogenase [Lactiplantibacillus mudanjiangensis]VDG19725.1 glucose-6-phosphate dehydrogenase [Lactobacillus paraplantarum] [Lactiplantibacillus mudanjiangensis]VDG24398.1 glucose-6-phosphate dehydrogenase [Lactobacillus paraplantarum] [Lactiplantibacillus mudanjiangensis]VDG28200.1 glucose-6-phosphate dehydrogenase [Lactobacillus paraplantarum] [Lactiplantibacillus mudanjiangensis]VDG31156.1 glucose-6-phosphate dehydrogenase [Lactobacillus paraplantarum] [Lactiplantiba
MNNSKPVLMILFGATGDLAKRKLYPAFFRLFRQQALSDHFAVIGTARRPWSDEHFHEVIADAIADENPTEPEQAAFVSHFYYQSHDVGDASHYQVLSQLADKLDNKYQLAGNRLYYLAMAPRFFGQIVTQLKSAGIIDTEGFNRVVLEKPFGTDFESANELSQQLTSVFPEQDIFRIDHYLGKEMIQNILTLRATNSLLESQWSNKHIENVQITFAEALGVEQRGGYYDQTGALKDMVQNHILQVLSLLAMELPTGTSETAIREGKVAALRAVKIYTPDEVAKNFVRGQYTAGRLNHEDFAGYREEPAVAEDSRTETFVAGKFEIDNDRWRGVPFYVRTGKRLTEKGTRINIVFKNLTDNTDLATKNVLTIYIQPTEGFSLSLNGKSLDAQYETSPIRLSYRHDSKMMANTPEAYERLMHDAIDGDATNFTHWDEVAQSWKIVDVIRQAWDQDQTPVPTYAAGTMGPKEAFDLVAADGNEWVWQPDTWFIERGLLKTES